MLRHLAVAQCVTGAVLALLFAMFLPAALVHGLAGWLAVALVVVLSGAYALGGGVQAGAAAALRGVLAVVVRWLLIIFLLAALAAQQGAVVWAIAAGAVLAYLVFLIAASTFKRV